MTYNKICFYKLISFIESSLSFSNPLGTPSADDHIRGVLLNDFIGKYSYFQVDEIKYCFHILRKLNYIVVEYDDKSKSYQISDFTAEGYKMLLSDFHE